MMIGIGPLELVIVLVVGSFFVGAVLAIIALAKPKH